MPPPLVSGAAAQSLVALASVAAIVAGGELFTTGTEWLSERFSLDEGTTGSLVAALATTLPETLIPLAAIAQGSGASVGVGAIVGGPVSLTTFALFVLGATAVAAADRRPRDAVAVNPAQTALDLRVFLAGFALALAAGFLRGPWTRAVGLPLVALYAWYLWRVLRCEADRREGSDRASGSERSERHASREGASEASGLDQSGGDVDPEPLELGRALALVGGDGDRATDPSRALVLVQVLFATALLLAGAHLFVEAVTWLATAVVGVPAGVAALLLAPLVSNVPENVDGVIWVVEGEDALGVEQVTGTLAFQGTVVAALGVAFTPWDLGGPPGTSGFLVAVAGVLAVVTGGYVYGLISRDGGTVAPRPLVGLGLPYLAFVALVAYYAVAGFV